MFTILALCFIAAFAAIGGLAATGLALVPAAAAAAGGAALVAAPVFGLVSLTAGLAAALLVLRRQGRAAAAAAAATAGDAGVGAAFGMGRAAPAVATGGAVPQA